MQQLYFVNTSSMNFKLHLFFSISIFQVGKQGKEENILEPTEKKTFLRKLQILKYTLLSASFLGKNKPFILENASNLTLSLIYKPFKSFYVWFINLLKTLYLSFINPFKPRYFWFINPFKPCYLWFIHPFNHIWGAI